MIALIGSEGSMGRRYQAILTQLREPFKALDKSTTKAEEIIKIAAECDRILIASPTGTHVGYLKALLPTKKPILCEKPITKNLDEIIDLHAECYRNGWSYNMVMQYRELDINKTSDRWSYYDNWNDGKEDDGIYWNCMQIIALAQGSVWIANQSPVWTCTINGRALSIGDMDRAYITHVQKWLTGSLDQTMDDILHAHRKVVEFREKQIT